VHLRSQWNAVGWGAQLDKRRAVLVIDSTGELKDWMAHADVVVVGKSFLAEGGQNPAEAILAGKPVVFGPHVENFEPLSTQLVAAGGAFRVENQSELTQCIQDMFGSDDVEHVANHGLTVLSGHSGATGKMIRLLVEMNL
jgi:3-deoxy-D-manno-octulosonic-acid transferase